MKIIILFLATIVSLSCMARQSTEYLDWVISIPINSGKVFGLYYSAKNNINEDLSRAMSEGWDRKNFEYLLKYDLIIKDSLTMYYYRNKIEEDYIVISQHYESFKVSSDSLSHSYWINFNLLEIEKLIEYARKGKKLLAEEFSVLLGKPNEKIQEYLIVAGYKKIPDSVGGYYVYSSSVKRNIKVYLEEHSIEYDWGTSNSFQTNDLKMAFWLNKIRTEVQQILMSNK